MNNSVSPIRFQSYAKRNPADWSWLIDQFIHHTKFGNGRILEVEDQRDPIFWVKFDQEIDGKSERSFVGSAFNGEFFDNIWLPEYQINIINADEQQRCSKERSTNTTIINQTTPFTSQNTLKPVVQTKMSSSVNKNPRVIQSVSVKCPYCVFSYPAEELSSHISRAHPAIFRKKAAKPQPVKSVVKEIVQVTKRKTIPNFFKCPYCPSSIKESHFAKHIRKVHPNQPIPQNPESAQPPKTHRRRKATGALPIPKQRIYRIRKSSGGVIQQTSIRTLNVGKHRGAILRRKSY